MSLESMIYQTLTGDTALSALLAKYKTVPAVFEQLAPDNQTAGWSAKQTPRIEFAVSREEDPERRVSGQISVTILHNETSNDLPAQIEVEVRRLLDGATFRPDGETITLQWQSAELFDDEAEFRGIDMVFDLIAWPTGLTYSPDPIKGLRTWAAARWAGLQVNPQTWAPTDASPALYWRLGSVTRMDMQSWGAWMTGHFHGHLLAKTPNTRISWLRKVAEGIAIDRAMSLEDGSRMFVESVSAASDADPLRAGQITMTARFGVLRTAVSGPKLENAYVTEVSL